MYWDVKKVIPLPEYKLYVELENGKNGVFDVSPYLDKGVLQELKDVNYFSQVSILLGAITWPHKQDIAPYTLLHNLQPVDSTLTTFESMPQINHPESSVVDV